MRFVVFAPPYNSNSGGAIALHKLADLIVKAGYECYIVPLFENHEASLLTWQQTLSRLFYDFHSFFLIQRSNSIFHLNPSYSGVLFAGDPRELTTLSDTVTVYPEIVFGNPLEAKKISRWLLHNPGRINGKVYFTKGEVQFLPHEGFSALRVPYLEVAPFFLHAFEVPWDYYSDVSDGTKSRSGVAYTVRKGSLRPIDGFDLTAAINIDGLEHSKISEIFKSVEYFISFDDMTFYSELAAISGVKSIKVTNNPDLRPLGVANGLSDVERAIASVPLLISKLKLFEADSKLSVDKFIEFWEGRLS